MELYEHNGDGPYFLGWSLRRYRRDGVDASAVVDTVRGITKPSSEGLFLSGGFDLDVDGTPYIGLSAPFHVPDLGADLYRAFPSAADVSVDHLLQPGGGRNAVPGDSFVPGDNDLWSIGNV